MSTYYSRNRDSIRRQHKEYYLKNHDSALRRKREYYLKHRDEILEYSKTLVRNKEGIYGQKKRLLLLELLGNKCSNPECLVPGGCIDMRCLQFDHINGGGRKDLISMGGNRGMIKYYLTHPDEAKQKLQILCANCNWIKRVIKKEVTGRKSFISHS